MSELVKRTYRIGKAHDKKVKKLSKEVSESEIVRRAITKYNV